MLTLLRSGAKPDPVHWRHDYERGKVIGAVFIDLTAAYDKVNNQTLHLKVARVIKSTVITNIIRSLLTSRRFFAEMCGKPMARPVEWTTLGFCYRTRALQYLHRQPGNHSKPCWVLRINHCISTQTRGANAVGHSRGHQNIAMMTRTGGHSE